MLNLKKDFPIFNSEADPLIYFDNAATTQKPHEVINAIIKFYTKQNANIHRGIYNLSEYATLLFEEVRKKVALFINSDFDEIIFTTGTTGSINFVALAWADKNVSQSDEIIISQMEHHSNLIPWQQLVKKKGAKLRVIPVTPDGQLDLEVYKKLLNERTKLVSIIHVSNVLGTTNDVNLITRLAHQVGAKVLVDAAQSVGHQKIDVKQINCDFLAFSGHKMLGPTGIGILYVKKLIYDQMEPYQFGGGMVFQVNWGDSKWLKPPYQYEPGTPPIAQAIGLGAAIEYINKNIDYEKLIKNSASFIAHIIQELSDFPNICFLGPVNQLMNQGHILSFTIQDLHPHDIAAFLDLSNICVRAGHHCSQQLHESLNIESSVRISFHCYNSFDEVELFINRIKKLVCKI